VAGKNWERYKVSDDASEITLEPGIVGARVNAILKPYGRKFGPDPASIGSCMGRRNRDEQRFRNELRNPRQQ